MGTSLRTLSGHDGELIYVSFDQTKPLVITSSHDGTFRIWNCRNLSSSVQISNDHTKAMNSTLVLSNNRLVSSSDDGFVHIWDSRTISCSPIISPDILAIPLDDSLRSPTAPSFNETSKNGNGTDRQNKKTNGNYFKYNI
ncbi:unnamed protein product [Adineta steineri]|uniref:Uncharacterized protein n=1 Tax=Adineta steineri TaxID=433720 RepID=A0A815SAB9_9BILA|nr:unnamed protein product [Adineta steineri]CAF4001337.1 unnamed protein product [Adineta steineri]